MRKVSGFYLKYTKRYLKHWNLRKQNGIWYFLIFALFDSWHLPPFTPTTPAHHHPINSPLSVAVRAGLLCVCVYMAMGVGGSTGDWSGADADSRLRGRGRLLAFVWNVSIPQLQIHGCALNIQTADNALRYVHVLKVGQEEFPNQDSPRTDPFLTFIECYVCILSCAIVSVLVLLYSYSLTFLYCAIWVMCDIYSHVLHGYAILCELCWIVSVVFIGSCVYV